MSTRIGILATHPTQYHAPLYRHLAATSGTEIVVYYAYKPTPEEQGEGFGVAFEWDVDLLSGYRNVMLDNRSQRRVRSGFNRCDTPEIADIIMNEKFNAFIVNGWDQKCYWQAIRASRDHRTPLLVRGDSRLGAGHPFYEATLKELTHRYLIARFDACLAVGLRSKEYFEHYGAKRIFMSPHFIDNQWFWDRSAQMRGEALTFRCHLGLSEKTVLFLFAGKLSAFKHPMDVLQALERALHGGLRPKDAHALIVGDGPMREACETYAREHSLPVSFAGFLNQSQMPKAYAASDVLVLPSDARETWGLVVNEAMACGLPALVSERVGCAPDLIENDLTGFQFPHGDIDKLAAGMQRMVVDRSFMRMGEAARQRIQNFSAARAAEGLLHAVESVKRIGR